MSPGSFRPRDLVPGVRPGDVVFSESPGAPRGRDSSSRYAAGFRFGSGRVDFATNLVANPADAKYIECPNPIREPVRLNAIHVFKHDDSTEARHRFRKLFVFAFEPNILTFSCDKPRARYQFKVVEGGFKPKLLLLDKSGSELPYHFTVKAACEIARYLKKFEADVKATSLFRIRYFPDLEIIGYVRFGFNDIEKIMVYPR